MSGDRPSTRRAWIGSTVVGIVTATFFSDMSHEMATAILPLYLTSIGLGPAALGVIEGIADFLVSLSKLAGGVLGHHVRRKKGWASVGYLLTALGTAGMGLVTSVAALVSFRGAAWIARGYRGPLRDHLLADAVEKTHYGRAYGLERAADMLGAVTGPLLAALLLWLAVGARSIILWTILPGAAAAGAMFFLVRESASSETPTRRTGFAPVGSLPRPFLLFTAGVFLFGLGDFSRTFLVWLAARGLGEGSFPTGGVVSVAVLLYAGHNVVAAAAAYPAGELGDRGSKLTVLIWGYVIGVITNALLAAAGGSMAGLTAAFVLSGIYISIEETLEKAVGAELLPRELRPLGFGVLAAANAVGDMLSSVYVGVLLQHGRGPLAFGLAAALGAAGVLWMLLVVVRTPRRGAAS